MRPFPRFIPPLPVQLAFFAFALTFSTAALKTFSWLGQVALPMWFYVAGGFASVLVFGLFYSFMWGMMSWHVEAQAQDNGGTPV
ncbi:hypothetical protein [Massilia sp. MS-15]|uniref:hypothetical protein n=1 Tax=Massilia sp. MS-15 TaxID=2878200 RepID=UPI001CD1A787|nr:hypothetical protein [Massilia sp. MS-15]MCA1246714.1 hypothetical protein [Massilia sp. MS-15]